MIGAYPVDVSERMRRTVEAALTGSLGALATLFDSPLIRGLLFACAVLALLALVIDLAVPRRLPGSLTRRVIEELVGAIDEGEALRANHLPNALLRRLMSCGVTRPRRS
jgi:hypothetical protein